MSDGESIHVANTSYNKCCMAYFNMREKYGLDCPDTCDLAVMRPRTYGFNPAFSAMYPVMKVVKAETWLRL